jgi:hypothetical protein
MGRESSGLIRFRGATGAGKLLLESDELILRGAVRTRLPRGSLAGWQAVGADLVIATAEGPLVATLDEAEARAWVAALSRPAPTLAQKLGLSEATPGHALTPIEDAALAAALALHPASFARAAILLAEVTQPGLLDHALAAWRQGAPRPLWIATIKGRASPLSEDVVRSALRGAGLIDRKTARVSDRMAATCYHLRG